MAAGLLPSGTTRASRAAVTSACTFFRRRSSCRWRQRRRSEHACVWSRWHRGSGGSWLSALWRDSPAAGTTRPPAASWSTGDELCGPPGAAPTRSRGPTPPHGWGQGRHHAASDSPAAGQPPARRCTSAPPRPSAARCLSTQRTAWRVGLAENAFVFRRLRHRERDGETIFASIWIAQCDHYTEREILTSGRCGHWQRLTLPPIMLPTPYQWQQCSRPPAALRRQAAAVPRAPACR